MLELLGRLVGFERRIDQRRHRENVEKMRQAGVEERVVQLLVILEILGLVVLDSPNRGKVTDEARLSRRPKLRRRVPDPVNDRRGRMTAGTRWRPPLWSSWYRSP